jgi:hypothetical protein
MIRLVLFAVVLAVALAVTLPAPASASDCRIPATRLPALWIPYIARGAQ